MTRDDLPDENLPEDGLAATEPVAAPLAAAPAQHAFWPGAARGHRLVTLNDFEAPMVLGDAERAAYQRRFRVLFVDDARARRGGLGTVAPAHNARSERFALKTMLVPAPAEGEDEASLKRRRATARAAFRAEYEAHRALAGIAGFPRLYGYAQVDGTPAIVMEWIQGVTLAEAARELAIDQAGRLSPLDAARLGSEVFALIARLAMLDGGVQHRDISPANVMLRTARRTVRAQAAEGTFDAVLIDFGSAAAQPAPGGAPFTQASGVRRHATEAYAPPEMLSDDIPHAARLRRAPAVDVYEAASVLYELLTGAPPFAGMLGQDAEASSDHAQDASDTPSPYRIKMDCTPPRPQGAHAPGCDLVDLLKREPEVALAAGACAPELGIDPGSEELRRALELVDSQLADLVMACLKPAQPDRPSAQAMQRALETWVARYSQNVARALRGEVLLPCSEDASWFDSSSPYALRRMVRAAGTAVSAGIGVVVVAATALALAGAPAALAWGDTRLWQGALPGPAVACVLVLPVLAGYLARGRRRGTYAGFVRGTVALVVCAVVLALAACLLALDPAGRLWGLEAAIFAVAAAGWCPLVLDYALCVMPAVLREARRGLPAPNTVAPGAARLSTAPQAPQLDEPTPDAAPTVPSAAPNEGSPHDE